MRVNPEFAKKLKKLGATRVTECFNCGNCTAICPLSTEDFMFPRKIIRYIQLGLEPRAIQSPEPWLCHACGECSTTCPRQAFPSEIMNSVRNYAFISYSTPRFMGVLFSSPVYLPIVIAISAVLLYFYLHLAFLGYLLLAYVAVVSIYSIWKFWRALGGETVSDFFATFKETLAEILKHDRFTKCETSAYRYYAHIGVFYGFVILGISKFVAILSYIPGKVLNNIGAIVLLVGAVWIVNNRITYRERVGSGSYHDWFFISLVFLLTITGILNEMLNFSSLTLIGYVVYLLHGLSAIMIFVFAPYSKFIHAFYRGFAMVIARSRESGESKVEAEETAAEAA
ncbi:MAG: 4Fe-4S dicluster domain-containing protein [Archaeoglobus sp.]|nr:4Fe-4S dicluster domain-containing protein [Archaeoglobus sp.]